MPRSLKKAKRIFLAFLVCFALTLQLHVEGYALSIEEERIAGETFRETVRKQLDMFDDDFCVAYINDLGQYLTTFLETKPFPFQFYIAHKNDLNAFAGPGGHVFFFTGLICAMDSVDEMAAVMAHEIAHVSARHISERIEQNKIVTLATIAGLLAGMLIGGKAAGALVTGSVAAGIQQQLSYSRDDERQADQLGFKYMDKAGFDPGAMAVVLKKLEQAMWIDANAVPPYLLTHPSGPERVSAMEIRLKDYTAGPENEENARFRRLFPYMKAAVIAKSDDAGYGERVFQRELEKNPLSAPAHFGMGLLRKEQLRYGDMKEHLEKALLLEPRMLPVLTALAEAYQIEGRNERAVEVLEKALGIDDKDRTALFLLALSYRSLEDYRKSIVFFERLASLTPVKDEVYYHLGMSYGRDGKLAQAHYNFGVYYMKSGVVDKARFHFQKAEELAGSDRLLKNKIQSAREGLRSKS
ncbi:MAG: M48 family metalloprotease [Deltaproteobacteria bacterium]|nr:M48 family metalloprotease [Deltaproteobacteria bacterium]